MERMGIDITEVSPDGARGTMPVEGNVQPYGILHGGASAVLAETLGSYAASVHAGDERAAVGIELNCTHHRAARSGLVSGVARAIHRGNSVATYEIVIDDEAGKRICTARLTCLIRPKPPAA
nr:hotdog fold thioesterase [Mobilicoccus caccae]